MQYLEPVPSYSYLLNIMFHVPMGRFQLELIYYFTYFYTVVPSNLCDRNTKSGLLQIATQWCHRRTKWPSIQTSPHISDLNSKINSPHQVRNKILKTNNYNNQWFKLQLSTAQARRQKWLQHPQDLLKIYQQRKAYRKEPHNCWMGRRWKNR